MVQHLMLCLAVSDRDLLQLIPVKVLQVITKRKKVLVRLMSRSGNNTSSCTLAKLSAEADDLR